MAWCDALNRGNGLLAKIPLYKLEQTSVFMLSFLYFFSFYVIDYRYFRLLQASLIDLALVRPLWVRHLHEICQPTTCTEWQAGITSQRHISMHWQAGIASQRHVRNCRQELPVNDIYTWQSGISNQRHIRNGRQEFAGEASDCMVPHIHIDPCRTFTEHFHCVLCVTRMQFPSDYPINALWYLYVYI